MKKIIFFVLISSGLFAQLPNTDIWLLDVKAGKDTIILSNPVNITHRPGYDNQPSFSPDGNSILYTSIRDEKQSDIYTYNVKTKTTTQYTNTPTTSEYSPNFTPDGTAISVVMVEPDSVQRLWEFPLKGGAPQLVMDKVDSIGYYCWINKDSLALIMITEPPALEMVNIKTQKLHPFSQNISRCIQLYPKQDNIFLYMQRNGQKDNQWQLKNSHIHYNDISNSRDPLNLPENSEDFCVYAFTQNNLIAFFGYNSNIIGTSCATYGDVSRLDLSKYGIKKITRIAISSNGKKMTIVAE